MKKIFYILLLLSICIGANAANENAKIVFVGDSRIAEVFGEGADPRNGIGHKITEICPAQVMVFAAGGQRMSRWNDIAAMVPSLSFVDSKSSIMYANGLFGAVKAVIIMLDYNDWVYGNSTIPNFIGAYREVIKYYKDNSIPVVIVTGFITIDEEETTWCEGCPTLGDFRAAETALGVEMGVPVIQGPSLIPQEQDYFNDSHHPNNLGASTAALNIVPQLQALDILPANY